MILVLLLSLVTAQPPGFPFADAIESALFSRTLLYQNNLNASDDVNHVGLILIDSPNQEGASEICAILNETLLTRSALEAHPDDFVQSLIYYAYAGRANSTSQSYYIDGGVVVVAGSDGNLTFQSNPLGDPALPALCTQSSNHNQPGNAVASDINEVAVVSNPLGMGGNFYVGFRNQKSFRFLGIPYANQPQRFAYSQPVTSDGEETVQALAYGSECIQIGGGSENCLFLNIQTPYLPAYNTYTNLRPVLFWIHDGKYAFGSGADPSQTGATWHLVKILW